MKPLYKKIGKSQDAVFGNQEDAPQGVNLALYLPYPIINFGRYCNASARCTDWIASFQVLKEADVNFGAGDAENESVQLTSEKRKRARALCEAVRVTLKEQSNGWKSRSLFERHWVIRDFKKTAGEPVEEWLTTLERLEESLRGDVFQVGGRDDSARRVAGQVDDDEFHPFVDEFVERGQVEREIRFSPTAGLQRDSARDLDHRFISREVGVGIDASFPGSISAIVGKKDSASRLD
jgi:hypothetical protein